MEPGQLNTILLQSVIIVFYRKKPDRRITHGKGNYNRGLYINSNRVKIANYSKKPRTLGRYLICTKCAELLNSFEGRERLKYFYPQGPPRFNLYAFRDLIVWDIVRRDFRVIGSDGVLWENLSIIPCDENFWEVYDNNIIPMMRNLSFI